MRRILYRLLTRLRESLCPVQVRLDKYLGPPRGRERPPRR